MGYRPHEGNDVTDSGIEMPGAGGGFHKSLKVDQLELDHRERVTLAVEVEVTKVRYDLINPDTNPDDNDPDDDSFDPDGPDPYALRRVHVLKVIGVARIDDDAVRARLDAQAAKVAEALADEKRAKAAARGELPLDGGDIDDTEPPEFCAHDRPAAECADCPPVAVDELAGKRDAADG